MGVRDMGKAAKGILFSIILGLLLTIACSKQDKNSSTDVFKGNVPYSKSDIVYYREDLEKGSIVLYKKDTSGFRLAFFSNKLKEWHVSIGNGVEINPKEGVGWTMVNEAQTPIVIFAGVISNNQIKSIVVKQKTLEKNAKIIKVNQDLSVWFVIFDVLEYGIPDPLKIEGMSDKGEILWKNGVY
jgi:hypothetical protein